MKQGDRVRLRAPERFQGHKDHDPATVGTVRNLAKIYWPQDVENPDEPDVLVEWGSGTRRPSYYPPEHLVVLDQSD